RSRIRGREHEHYTFRPTIGNPPSAALFERRLHVQEFTEDLALGDLDGDGDLDALVAARRFFGSSLYLLRNYDAVVNLGVTVTDDRTSAAIGKIGVYQVVVTNAGPDPAEDAQLMAGFAPALQELAWTAEGTPGTVFVSSGFGEIHETVIVPVGGAITYTISGRLTAAPLESSLQALVRVNVPASDPLRWVDAGPSDNVSSDSDIVISPLATQRAGRFSDSGLRLGNEVSIDVAPGDIDNDGDTDLLVATLGPRGVIAYRNDRGAFTVAWENLGLPGTTAAKLADLDGDDDLDAVFAASAGSTSVWWNDGNGGFEESGQRFPLTDNIALALADFDRDGDLDALLGQGSGLPSGLWFNDGQGQFADSGMRLPIGEATRILTHDFDTDGDVDFVTDVPTTGDPSGYWSNEGASGFSFKPLPGVAGYWRIEAIADIDNNGMVDVVAVGGSAVNVYRNTPGGWSISQQLFLKESIGRVEFGDFDGDSDLDMYFANGGANVGLPDRILRNNGGMFVDSGQTLSTAASRDVALADFDQDGDLDAFVANGRFSGGQPDELWLNGPVPGDTYPFDGVVDLTDLNRVRNNFGATSTNAEGDANADGIVNLADLNLVRNHFGGANSSELIAPVGARIAETRRPAVRTTHRSTDLLFSQWGSEGTANHFLTPSLARSRRRK
ncbi:MAG: FG-GAP-like repeat-containing protein, partial [Planctomycetia bacterium]|nr:FG-GAP-like repeat-containing protein [Planctomycetia bacterium]